MKNKYTLKSSINNAHRIICQDSMEVCLEKIDSVFAKIIYKNTHKNHDSRGILSHVKGLNLISKKSLFMNYSDDEAIKKYNKKASINAQFNDNINSNLDTQKLNEMVKNEQKNKADILSKALQTSHTKLESFLPNHIDKDFFAHLNADEYAKFATKDSNALKENFSSIKNTLDSKESKQDSIESSTECKDGTLVLVNPYKLREYSFVVPEYITIILNITKNSKIYVYCPLDLASPLEKSLVNYLFPIIFNTETKLAAQIPLSIMDYPDFSPQTLSVYL